MRFHLTDLWHSSPAGSAESAPHRTLANVHPGRDVLITGFIAALTGGQKQHLQAYGLLPGRRVRILAQRPVTIIQVEQTELAFENSLAAGVLVGD